MVGNVGGPGGARSLAHVVKSGSELEKQEKLWKKLKEYRIRREEQEKASTIKAIVGKADADKADADKAAAGKVAASKAVDESTAKATAQKNDAADEATSDVANNAVSEVPAVDHGVHQVSAHGPPDSLAVDQSTHGRVSAGSSSGSELCETVLVKSPRERKPNLKRKAESDWELSDSDMDEKDTEKPLKKTNPCIKGVAPRVEFDSHATSKGGLTSDSEVSHMSDQSVNSQATSKAGLSMGSDQDVTAVAGGSGLQKIIPEEGSSS